MGIRLNAHARNMARRWGAAFGGPGFARTLAALAGAWAPPVPPRPKSLSLKLRAARRLWGSAWSLALRVKW